MAWAGWAKKKHWTNRQELVVSVQKKLHPRNLTGNLKLMVSKWTFLFQGLIFRFHVKFRGCTCCMISIPPTSNNTDTSTLGSDDNFCLDEMFFPIFFVFGEKNDDTRKFKQEFLGTWMEEWKIMSKFPMKVVGGEASPSIGESSRRGMLRELTQQLTSSARTKAWTEAKLGGSNVLWYR